jgi:thiosulfate dehydrogenase (quinone) large subunit
MARQTTDTMQKKNTSKRSVKSIDESPASRVLFGDVRLAWIWLLVRLYVGWTWLQAGWEKVQSAAWTGSEAGTALTGFVKGALTQSTGAHPNVQTWDAWFLQNAVLPNVVAWGYLVAWGETLVGLALILGLFTGIAAFFGSFMNVNYLMAGAVSINPYLLLLEILLMLAWRTAGWLGVDRFFLPALGTPWSPGYIFYPERA